MKRAVRSIIRLIAAGLLLFGGIELGWEFIRHRVQKSEISAWHCALGGILIALGILSFWASGRLAEQFTDDFEE